MRGKDTGSMLDNGKRSVDCYIQLIGNLDQMEKGRIERYGIQMDIERGRSLSLWSLVEVSNYLEVKNFGTIYLY